MILSVEEIPLMQHYYTIHQFGHYFGQAYGEGAYGEGKYSCTTEQERDGLCTVAATTTDGNLSNTGVAIAGIVTLACLLVFIALVVRIWHRRRPVAQEVASQSESTDQQSQDDHF